MECQESCKFESQHLVGFFTIICLNFSCFITKKTKKSSGIAHIIFFPEMMIMGLCVTEQLWTGFDGFASFTALTTVTAQRKKLKHFVRDLTIFCQCPSRAFNLSREFFDRTNSLYILDLNGWDNNRIDRACCTTQNSFVEKLPEKDTLKGALENRWPFQTRSVQEKWQSK